MGLLKAEIAKKRQRLEEDTNGKRFFKRSKIEQKQIQKHREQEKHKLEAKAQRQAAASTSGYSVHTKPISSFSTPSLLAMNDRPPSSYGSIYVPSHHLLCSVITTPNYSSLTIGSELHETKLLLMADVATLNRRNITSGALDTRCNRTTDQGFYKITGKEREIRVEESKAVIGKMRILTFYEACDVKDRNVQWVFLGCPDIGKGTYTSRLCHLLGVPHIATGDLVRDELAASGPFAIQLVEVVNPDKCCEPHLPYLAVWSQKLWPKLY
ncbi:hypothetical protein C1H46_031010 [Malus baccata]|uniref:adenylate kinase n=1 Tax=Malus baccata TaxID=106549 RepID=A0A540LAY3_MALBA|nr:hypothetical protein C1H46_031010 [Malus baccata]